MRVDADILDGFQIFFINCIPIQMFVRISKLSLSNKMQLFMVHVILLTHLGSGPRDRSFWVEEFLYTLWSSCNNLHSTQSRNLHSCSQGIVSLHKSPQLQNCVKDIFFKITSKFCPNWPVHFRTYIPTNGTYSNLTIPPSQRCSTFPTTTVKWMDIILYVLKN